MLEKMEQPLEGPLLLGRLRQENCLNPGGGGCSELEIVPTALPASDWVTRSQSSISKNKTKQKNKNPLESGHT
uniref:Uncharacterized protein n=1 Tax=Astyanax mexicanus TaxID=7994 RepID=A0A3B1KHL3_ASTMX